MYGRGANTCAHKLGRQMAPNVLCALNGFWPSSTEHLPSNNSWKAKHTCVLVEIQSIFCMYFIEILYIYKISQVNFFKNTKLRF